MSVSIRLTLTGRGGPGRGGPGRDALAEKADLGRTDNLGRRK